jgi:hypothetical protein
MKALLTYLLFTTICLPVAAQNLSGKWTGSLFQQSAVTMASATYIMELDVLHTGSAISGTAKYVSPRGYYVIERFSGTVAGKRVVIVENKVIECTMSGFSWCIKTLEGFLSTDTRQNRQVMEGTWEANIVYDGTVYLRGSCAPGTFKIYKSLPPKINEQPAITISGSVFDKKNKKPLPARISISGANNKNHIILTNNSGKYSFKPVAGKAYQVVISADGFHTSKEAFNVKKTTVKNFYLNGIDKEITVIKQTKVPKKVEPTIRPPVPTLTRSTVFLDRKVNLQKTINVISDSIDFKFYDNGEFDHDTITVYYNKVPVLRKQCLGSRALVLRLPIITNSDNELIMFADNLGSIPPNTALLKFIDNGKWHEITIDSDKKSSGSIIIRREE